MIASVRGPIVHIGLDHAIVEAAGVGYLVRATPNTLALLRRGEEATLLTAMLVRDDAMTLYGFTDAGSREMFDLLQTVTGVGPRLALAVLAVFTADELATVLATEDVRALTRVPGVGRRTAERLALELRDKVAVPPGAGTETAEGAVAGSAATGGVRGQVAAALVGLGFTDRQADGAVEAVFAENTDLDAGAALRRALALLGPGR